MQHQSPSMADLATVRDSVRDRFEDATHQATPTTDDTPHKAVYWAELERHIYTLEDYDTNCALVANNEMKCDRTASDALRRNIVKRREAIARLSAALADMPQRTARRQLIDYRERIAAATTMLDELYAYVEASIARMDRSIAARVQALDTQRRVQQRQ